MMTPEELRTIGVARMSAEQHEALGRWGLRMFGLGRHRDSEINEIRYDGRLVILEDGSRWSVSSLDVGTADLWSAGDRVAVIDNEMFRLDDSERVAVDAEDD